MFNVVNHALVFVGAYLLCSSAHAADFSSLNTASYYSENFIVNEVKITCQHIPHTSISLCQGNGYEGVIFWQRTERGPFLPFVFYHDKFKFDFEVKAYLLIDNLSVTEAKYNFSINDFLGHFDDVMKSLTKLLPQYVRDLDTHDLIVRLQHDLMLLESQLNPQTSLKVHCHRVQQFTKIKNIVASEMWIDVKGSGTTSLKKNLPEIDDEILSIDDKKIFIDQQYEVKKPISLFKAKEIFAWIMSMTDIFFDDYIDGCFARSYLIADRIHNAGFNVGQIWVKADIVSPNDANIEWEYHVAPFLMVTINGQKRIVMIDPTIEKRLLFSYEWLTRLGLPPHKTIHKMAFYPLPAGSNIRGEVTLGMSSHVPIYPYKSCIDEDQGKLAIAYKRHAQKRLKEFAKAMKSYRNNES